MERGERARPLPTTFLKGPKLGSLGVFVFGIPGFSQARSGGLQGCQCCQGSGCALRNTNLLTHRAGDCDRQRSATSRKCFQVENSVLFFLHHFHFECGAHFFFLLFFVFSVLFFSFFYADQKSWKINFGFLAFLRVHSFVVFVFRFFAAQQATRLFVFVALFCFILLPLSAARCFPPFFILPRHLSFPLPNTRTLAHSAVLLPLAPCLFFATFPQCFVEGRGKVGGGNLQYILSILFTRKLQVYEAICMRI